MKSRLPSWLAASLLAAPLVVLTAWVLRGALAPSVASPAAARPAGVPLAGLPQPTGDFPAERLEERVDGGADALRADGCRRILYWRFEAPPADAEALVFRTAKGARTVLAREAGNERTPGPGEEAQLSPQSVYFRRGPVYVRVFLDPGATASDDLRRRAFEIDRALREGGTL